MRVHTTQAGAIYTLEPVMGSLSGVYLLSRALSAASVALDYIVSVEK
jgi:threonine/homoserine efflux transporter RhtA